MPQDTSSPSLVSTEWLATHMTAPDVRIVDASWYLPQAGRNAREEYDQRHLEGAHFIDIDGLSDPDSAYPHMLPPPEMFASRMRKLGLGDGLRIIIYDGAGIYSAARVWWMFRVMGFQDVAVLDGGLPKWLAEGRPVTDEPPILRDRHATARLDHTRLRDATQVRGNIYTAKELLVDARSAGRFNGTEPEPRAGVRSGHVPGAISLPFNLVLDDDGTMRSPDELRAITKTAGIDLSKPVIAMCGSGVTACVVALALDQIGHRRVSVYDGSWAEWGAQADLPIEV